MSDTSELTEERVSELYVDWHATIRELVELLDDEPRGEHDEQYANEARAWETFRAACAELNGVDGCLHPECGFLPPGAWYEAITS